MEKMKSCPEGQINCTGEKTFREFGAGWLECIPIPGGCALFVVMHVNPGFRFTTPGVIYIKPFRFPVGDQPKEHHQLFIP